MKILSYRQCQEAKLPVTPPFTDDERIAQEQDRYTMEQVEALLSFTVEVKGNTVIIDRHDWDNFWQELKKLAEGK